MKQKRYRIFVSGDVQGVGFRWYARRFAAARGVTGWVRNTEDGRVEITAEGSAGDLAGFIGELKGGFLGENISRLEKIEEPATGEYEDFRIIL